MLGQILRLPKCRKKDANMKGSVLHWNFYSRNKDVVLCQHPKTDRIDTRTFSFRQHYLKSHLKCFADCFFHCFPPED